MTYISTIRDGHDGIAVHLIPGGVYEHPGPIHPTVLPPRITVELAGMLGGDAMLSLSISDARTLLAALPGLLAQVDADAAGKAA